MPEPFGTTSVPAIEFGAAVSTMIVWPDELPLVLPAASVAVAVMVWLPAPRVEVATDQ